MAWQLWRVRTRPFGGKETGRADARVVVAGAPLDSTSSFVPGCRLGPEYIRLASESLEFYSYLLEEPVELRGYYDEGDLFPPGLGVGGAVEVLRSFYEDVAVGEGRKAVLLGGEHTAVVGASPLVRKASLIVAFDAHVDLRDEYLGDRYNHATALRRLLEQLQQTEVVYVGSRAIDRDELSYLRRRGIRVYTSRHIALHGAGHVARRIEDEVSAHERVYVSFDMDVFDPAFAPGVGTPEPLGLDPHSVFAVLRPLFQHKGALGLDVVETNPLMDRGFQTSSLAAKVVMEFIALQAR